ncbi:MAG: Fe(2+)-trafficking protein [Phycisphaeraceae bacterium]|nr:Fe(2+)-trafficking protein [Phycisphaeraceae bacterium]
MMDVAQRIAQFETMVRPEADPNNDMAWFSLAQAYADAGRHADAATAFLRCTTLNPVMSKAYQLAGKALIESGQRDQAVSILTDGYKVATRRGEYLPQKGIKDLLESLGAPVPEAEAAQVPIAPEGSFLCTRTGRPGNKMARPPFRGPVGAWIAEHISQETWDDWVRQGTKVINEMRLDLSRDEDSETYDRQMREYLGIDDALLEQIRSK